MVRYYKWPDGEVSYRKVLALMSPTDPDLRQTKTNLVYCLTQENKLSEADKIPPPERGPNGVGARQYDWFLTDEEKAAVEKSDKEKARNAKQK